MHRKMLCFVSLAMLNCRYFSAIMVKKAVFSLTDSNQYTFPVALLLPSHAVFPGEKQKHHCKPKILSPFSVEKSLHIAGIKVTFRIKKNVTRMEALFLPQLQRRLDIVHLERLCYI